jgi:hypothetical protein
MLCVALLSLASQSVIADQTQLRTDFNRAKGNVRVVMLVSPT